MLALLGVALATTSAHAQPSDSSCLSAQRRAVEHAAQATGLRIAPLRCMGPLMVLRLFPEGAAPLDVELREPGDGAFRTFGGFGLSPIVEVADYMDLPEPQRVAFARLAAYLESSPDRAPALLSGPIPSLEPVHDLVRSWPLALALGLFALLLAARRSPPVASARALLGLFALALGLRLAFGLWGPLHVNGQGALWILSVLDPSRLTLYGPGYAELFGWARHLARPDLAIFASNAILGALMAPLAFRVGELSDLPRPAALVAGLTLAIDPVSVRISASESYFMPLGVLLMLIALAVALARRQRLRRAPVRVAWALLAAGLLAAQVARTHPVGWLPVALMPLLALGPQGGLRKRLGLVLLCASVMGALTLLISGDLIATSLAHAQKYGDATRLNSSWMVDFGLGLALFLLFARRCRTASPALVTLGVVGLAVDLATRHIYGQSALWMASFDRLYLPMLLWGALSYWPRRARSWTGATLAACALGLGLFVSGPSLNTRTTEQLEYAFVADALTRAPAGCWVSYVQRAEERVMSLPSYAVPRTADGARARDLSVAAPGGLEALAQRTDCLLYVHASICQSRQGAEICRRVERGARLEPLSSTQLEARPSYDGLPYDAPRVAVEIFRLRPRD
ncbi:MAG: hypothetical protein GXP55_08985 [Deltaproteobacteria bacterium]|nr:hypothetical protein [Deltaproteobacteria bacterium]